MVSPPAPSARRALWAAVWLLVTFGGLIGAVWGVGWALDGRDAPSLATVTEATHLAYPEDTDVVEADLTAMQVPTPGDRAEVTVDIPEADFGDFIADNNMEAPLIAGTTPAGAASGIIPAGCTAEACYSATIVVTDESVTVRLAVTLL